VTLVQNEVAFKLTLPEKTVQGQILVITGD